MVNFTDVASRQSFRLKETPTWRKRPGEGLTQTYAKMREESYRRNASIVRDRRFQQSIGKDPDYALKIQMNKMLADNQFLAGRTGDVELMRGMYSKLTPKFSRSAGTLVARKPDPTRPNAPGNERKSDLHAACLAGAPGIGLWRGQFFLIQISTAEPVRAVKRPPT
jgi:hypothetical protein